MTDTPLEAAVHRLERAIRRLEARPRPAAPAPPTAGPDPLDELGRRHRRLRAAAEEAVRALDGLLGGDQAGDRA